MAQATKKPVVGQPVPSAPNQPLYPSAYQGGQPGQPPVYATMQAQQHVELGAIEGCEARCCTCDCLLYMCCSGTGIPWYFFQNRVTEKIGLTEDPMAKKMKLYAIIVMVACIAQIIWMKTGCPTKAVNINGQWVLVPQADAIIGVTSLIILIVRVLQCCSYHDWRGRIAAATGAPRGSSCNDCCVAAFCWPCAHLRDDTVVEEYRRFKPTGNELQNNSVVRPPVAVMA